MIPEGETCPTGQKYGFVPVGLRKDVQVVIGVKNLRVIGDETNPENGAV